MSFNIKFTRLGFENVLEALPGKFDIKRHSPSILHIYTMYSSNRSSVTLYTVQLVKKLPNFVHCSACKEVS